MQENQISITKELNMFQNPFLFDITHIFSSNPKIVSLCHSYEFHFPEDKVKFITEICVIIIVVSNRYYYKTYDVSTNFLFIFSRIHNC